MTHVPRKASRLRRFSAVRVLTAWQQAAFALAFAALGAAGVMALELNRQPAAPILVLDPVIERFETDYSVYRFRFSRDGQEIFCHGVFWGAGKWTVRC